MSTGHGGRAEDHIERVCQKVNITGYEAAGLVRSLVKKGFLCEPENGHLELSDKENWKVWSALHAMRN